MHFLFWQRHFSAVRVNFLNTRIRHLKNMPVREPAARPVREATDSWGEFKLPPFLRTVNMFMKLIFASIMLVGAQVKGTAMNEIRTYMAFTYPVDPVKIFTIPDMDVSKALGTTLVEWDAQKQISGALAEKWIIVGKKTYRLTIRKGTRWSNGEAITANDVKISLERGLKSHPHDLRSLSNILERIDCASLLEIDFHLKVDAHESGLLAKLTEPNYGIFKVNKHGLLDLTISTGAFSLSPQSTQRELVLEKNPNWYRSEAVSAVADQVILRRAPTTMDAQTILLNDSWPNVIETSSLIQEELLNRYVSDGYQIWRRPIDKVLLFKIGKRTDNHETRKLLQTLRESVSVKDFVKGYSGFQEAEQLFPRGYQLHDRSFSCPKSDLSSPEMFKKRPVEIVYSPARISDPMRRNIQRIISKMTGLEPRMTAVGLEDLGQTFLKGDFDLYVGTVGLADPDPEGAMSYYLEGDTPIIQSQGTKFLERLDSARKEKTNEARLTGMRSILRDAVCNGFVFPIIHLSTLGIARPELDLSQIPESDESITLSKVRHRGK